MTGGVKRDRSGNARVENAPRGRFHDMFERFRDDLDEHYDRRERIIKASRDVTAHSKKIIFTLQRVKKLNEPLPAWAEKDIAGRMEEIAKLLQSVNPDLQAINRHRYTWQMRCLEELVEALSFQHYLRHQRLITPEEAQAAAGVELTGHDYMFGIFDLFGEMMRFATVTSSQGELAGSEGRSILGDIQELGCAFEMLQEIPTRDYRSKMEAMRQSVKKVEKLGYGLAVRGSERPRGWVPDDTGDE